MALVAVMGDGRGVVWLRESVVLNIAGHALECGARSENGDE